jgi:hypothetical protein
LYWLLYFLFKKRNSSTHSRQQTANAISPNDFQYHSNPYKPEIPMIKNPRGFLIIALIISSLYLQSQTRDPYFWPFESTSIWNTPIGDSAIYVYAGIQPATAWGLTIDEDYIHMIPDAPLTPVMYSSAGWSSSKSRCDADGNAFYSVPMKKNWEISRDTWEGNTPNSGLAVLMPDGRTIKQNQPFARCEKGKHGTTKYASFDDVDLYGDGIRGAHGGSGLSALGGAIRVGELVPGGEINHALKVNLYSKKNLYYGERKGHRWPAPVADGYAADNYHGIVEACTMGALLAIPSTVNLDTFALETEPARIIARTLQRYGAYIVDDTGWDVYAIITEWSPTGRVSKEFESVWGFSMKQRELDTPWVRDIFKIMNSLHVVDNNSDESVGGGGNPIAPNAPEFGRAGNIVPKISLTQTVSEVFVGQGESVVLAADAFDVDGSISEVQFFVGNSMVGSVTSEPYQVDWVADSPGSFLMVAKGIDNEYGTAVTHGLRINVDAAQVKDAPVISLESSNGAEPVNDGHSIVLSIQEEEGSVEISKVDYYEGFHFIDSSTKAPFNVTVDFIDAGKHHYIAKAIGKNGTIGYAEAITVESFQENDPPTCIITQPVNNAIFTNPKSVIVKMDAVDVDSEIQHVELYVNDELVRTMISPPFQYTIANPQAGNYVIYAKVYDVEGEFTDSQIINVTVAIDTNIEELDKPETGFFISPNPLKEGSLSIEFKASEPHEVEIVSVNGQVLYQNDHAVGNLRISYNSISYKGLCIVKVTNTSGNNYQKMMVL